MIACLLSIPLLTLQPTSAQSTDYIEKTFSWDYDGHHWNWNLSIPTALYEAYKSVPLVTRTHNGPSGYGYLTTTEDPYVQMLANKLNQTTTELGYSPYDQVSFALAFVQSLPYTSDNVTEGYNEYPRFPIETLVDDGGDCEDTSILFATITSIMGYGTVYLSPPSHYAVGILGSNIVGTSWEYPEGTNRTYYYCETTGDNFKIGQLPFEFLGQNAFIYPIDESVQYIPEIIVTTTEPTPTRSAIIGSASPTPAPNSGGDPTAQTPMPLSFNLVEKNPGASILIIFAIVGSFALAIWSVRKPHVIHKEKTEPEPTSESATLTDGGDQKFCTSCGSQNRESASFCDKCGKQISD
ncbi:MAG TPA: zinc ribbon domain-containing protein [Candidatus Acidoferrales bacterium]|nr:zinc ribbon domain-containing protein [Candidatus Acidoferrales bacterium]